MPGTQEIRTKIGHLGFWAGVVYGNGIFMTISPGERHNYLAIRLSRFRKDDPFATKASTVDTDINASKRQLNLDLNLKPM